MRSFINSRYVFLSRNYRIIVLFFILGVFTPRIYSQTNQELINKGKALYTANCTACHNRDPKKNGTLGPDIFGSSLELLTLRILKLEYPKGYVPKRKSKAMRKLPHLAKNIPAIHAFLNTK